MEFYNSIRDLITLDSLIKEMIEDMCIDSEKLEIVILRKTLNCYVCDGIVI